MPETGEKATSLGDGAVGPAGYLREASPARSLCSIVACHRRNRGRKLPLCSPETSFAGHCCVEREHRRRMGCRRPPPPTSAAAGSLPLLSKAFRVPSSLFRFQNRVPSSSRRRRRSNGVAVAARRKQSSLSAAAKTSPRGPPQPSRSAAAKTSPGTPNVWLASIAVPSDQSHSALAGGIMPKHYYHCGEE
nr:hypothetical protein Itr_chr04CG18630 [Ipomoea trifida]